MNLLLLGLPSLALSAVTFHGPDGLLESTVTCKSGRWSDTDFANLIDLGFVGVPGISQNGTTFELSFSPEGGTDDALAIEGFCYDVDPNAETECHETRLETAEGDSEASPHGKRQVHQNQLRADFNYCNNYGNDCFHRIDTNFLGLCPSGYRFEVFSVPHKPKGVYCTRYCTNSEQQNCNRHTCDVAAARCNYGGGDSNECNTAIIRCRKFHDVVMRQQFCSGPRDGSSTCRDCVSYDGSKCHVDNERYDAWTKAQDDEFMWEYSQF